jgi:hypothetical protein
VRTGVAAGEAWSAVIFTVTSRPLLSCVTTFPLMVTFTGQCFEEHTTGTR